MNKLRVTVLLSALIALMVGPTLAQNKPGTTAHIQKKELEAQAEANHHAMMAKMEDLDTRLHHKMMAMQQAKGDKKVEAMAAVIEELVAQRQTMHNDMMGTMPQMMGHMMQHMEMGDTMADMMANCPMMKETKTLRSGVGRESKVHSGHDH